MVYEGESENKTDDLGGTHIYRNPQMLADTIRMSAIQSIGLFFLPIFFPVFGDVAIPSTNATHTPQVPTFQQSLLWLEIRKRISTDIDDFH